MCGISGHISNHANPLNFDAFMMAASAQNHRGPDAQGHKIINLNKFKIYFAHQRLSILDLSDDGIQPMQFNGNSLIFNGEIYNYLELKDELIKAGYSFSTSTDTEVINIAFHHWGIKESLQKFNGMWALAYFQESTGKVFLSRDRFGEKPIYYGNIKNKFRPGHADFTYFKKYGIRDYRGGGRQSARETASRVAAGGIAKQILKFILGKKYDVVGGVTQLGILGSNPENWNEKFIKKNQLFCPDKSVLKLWEKYLLSIRKAGSSCGAIIEIRAKGVPVGLGAPIYSKLDMDLASAMMSINAVKGVNIGSGMNSAQLTGEENSDEINQRGKSTKFNSNNAGGILGGISSGQDIIVSFAVKPTSSILSTRKTIDKFGKNTTISVKGRHDPCVGIRAVPIGEAMMHCVILDHYLLNKAQCGN